VPNHCRATTVCGPAAARENTPMTNEPISLYLVRHAIAAERGDDYPDDGKRPLTERGIKRFRKIAKALAELGVEVDVILSSPLVRARQTAEILSQTLAGHPAIVETDALLPGASFVDLAVVLGEHASASSLALTGHQPSIGAFAARLAGCKGEFEIKKGGACRVDVAELPPTGPGQLRWLATPRMLTGLRG
jgi:phosphohistidine phosphatase